MPSTTPRLVNRSKRIAYVMSRFPKISETFILYEILELERQGFSVEVFPLVREREQVEHGEARGVVERARYSRPLARNVWAANLFWLLRRPVAYLRAWQKALAGNRGSAPFLLRAVAVVLQAAWFAREMYSLGVEHVHAHYATHPALAAWVVRELAGIPYSFTAHAHDIYVERPMLDEKIKRAGFVVTISDYNRRLLRELYGAAANSKISVIHCGVDPTIFQPGALPEPGRALQIVCVASLQEYKGHPYLLEALAQLAAAGVPFRCRLIGEGEGRPALEAQIAQLALGTHVELLGAQPRQRVSELVSRADVVVQPSITVASGKKEGIPVALMEALASERAVVATAISGVPELVEHEHTGLLVPERDSTAIAGALLRLHNDPELRRSLGSAGREKVLREYDLQRNAAALGDLLAKPWSGTDPQLIVSVNGTAP